MLTKFEGKGWYVTRPVSAGDVVVRVSEFGMTCQFGSPKGFSLARKAVSAYVVSKCNTEKLMCGATHNGGGGSEMDVTVGH